MSGGILEHTFIVTISCRLRLAVTTLRIIATLNFDHHPAVEGFGDASCAVVVRRF
jgi:hypothetical protein